MKYIIYKYKKISAFPKAIKCFYTFPVFAKRNINIYLFLDYYMISIVTKVKYICHVRVIYLLSVKSEANIMLFVNELKQNRRWREGRVYPTPIECWLSVVTSHHSVDCPSHIPELE